MLAQSLLVEQAKIGPERAKSSQAIQQMVGRTSARRRSHAKNMARAARTNMAREFNQSAADSMPAVRLTSGDPVPQEPALPSLSTVIVGLRENRDLEGRHRFYRFRTPLRGRRHRFYRALPFLLNTCNRNNRNLGSQPKRWGPIQQSQCQSLRLAPKSGVTRQTSLLLTRMACFRRFFLAEGNVTVM